MPRTRVCDCRRSQNSAAASLVGRLLLILLVTLLPSACGSQPPSAVAAIENLSLARVVKVSTSPAVEDAPATSAPDPELAPSPTAPPSSPTPADTATEIPSPTTTPTLSPTSTDTPVPPATPSATDVPTSTPLPPVSQGSSILDQNTIITYYGRCFSPNPDMDSVAILGQLAMYDNFDQFYSDISQYSSLVDEHNGEKGVIAGMNIIYELATGSAKMGDGTYLLNVDAYLKAYDAGSLEENYIKPARDRGILVFLDNQLGLSSIYAQAQEMLHFLKEYDNVHFFFDAEFHIYPGQLESGQVSKPGSPQPGQIDADDINAALGLIRSFMSENGITREVIVGFHQFQDVNVQADTRDMIINKSSIVIPPGISIVIDADGFSPAEASQRLKWAKYKGITDPEVYDIFGRGAYPGIKIFPPSPYVSPSMYDYDVLTVRQLMGVDPTSSGDFFVPPPAMVIVN